MKTQTSKTFKLVLAAAAVLLTPILAGANQPPKIANRPSKTEKSAQRAQLRAATAASSQYSFVTIDVSGAAETFAYGVNNTRAVSGYYLDEAGNYDGFLWQKSGEQTVDYPGAANTELGDANDWGLVIGNHGTATTMHGATYSVVGSVWNTLPDIPGQPLNFGDGINDLGVGTGAACEGDTNVAVYDCVGWTWDRGAYWFFTVPEADAANGGTFPNGINNRGQVVGYFEDTSGASHGFLKNGDSFVTIDAPLASNTYAFDINDQDDVAGFYVDQDGNYDGFVQGSDGKFTTVDVPGADATFIFGNNDRGDLAGYFEDSSGVHGFVAFKK